MEEIGVHGENHRPAARPKIPFYLFGIAAQPTEKNCCPKQFFFIKKIRIAPEFRSCPQSLFRALSISNLDRKSA
jgi:hypothetical protein